jgi:hypothetical protein
MANIPNEPLTMLELLALVLMHAGMVDCDAGDAIPRRVFEELQARGLIGNTDTTPAGDVALFEWIEYSAALKAVA